MSFEYEPGSGKKLLAAAIRRRGWKLLRNREFRL